MTEDQAKTKWCPFTRIYNRTATGTPTGSAYCLASACMAWRRQTVFIDRATNEPAVPGKAAIGDLELWYSNEGYCGLAGAPQ